MMAVTQQVTRWNDVGSPDWILKALREAGSSLVSELHGFARRRLQPSLAYEATFARIIAHLVEAERLAQEQITAILDGTPDPIPVRDVEAVMEDDAPRTDLAEGLARFESLRARTLRLLWGLREEDWQRPGRHPYRGDLTPTQIARELAHHDLEHLWQVRGLKAAGDAPEPS